jgi:hypothetical protein
MTRKIPKPANPDSTRHKRRDPEFVPLGEEEEIENFLLGCHLMFRAVFEMFPEDRMFLEVHDLCVCKLLREEFHHYWTGEVPKGEITDKVKKYMIRRVEGGRGKAYRQANVCALVVPRYLPLSRLKCTTFIIPVLTRNSDETSERSVTPC